MLFNSFESILSNTASYNSIPRLDIIDLTSEQTVEDISMEDNVNSLSITSFTSKRTPTNLMQNPYVKKQPRTQVC